MKLDDSEQKAAVVELAQGMICAVINKTEHCIATHMLQVAVGNVYYVIIVICTFGR